MLQDILKKLFGTNHERQIRKIQPRVAAINALEPEIKKLSDAQLKARTAELKQKLDNGATLDDVLFEAFATAREAGRRVLGMRHYDVQLIGGMVLHDGKIAEMKTGEGKTLVATLPCYLNALSGKGVHVVTVNDYLAKRDAEWMGRLYNWLGLSYGVVIPSQSDQAKKNAYRADITYGQNNEFGFDYLRDNMKFSIYDYAQRELNFAIVDEVDSILVDEARTPLIISGQGEVASDKYLRIARIMPRLRKDEHYVVDEKFHNATFTEEGIERAQQLLVEAGIMKSENLFDPVNLETLHILNKSLIAHTLYKRDQHYMVTADQKVVIVDEFTGRVLAGRRWSDGLHQAVEAKEGVPIQAENRTLATISFQNYFRLYKKIAGMTGTADTEAEEFHKIYKLDVTVIPTNKPIQRSDQDDLVFKTEREKFKAVYEDIVECHKAGQPVLVGTTSVEKSEALHRMLAKAEIPHNVLNAKQHEREAYVVAQAGRKGAITIATNMAGRGTDILLGGNPEMLAKYRVMDRANAEGNVELLQSRELFEAAVKEEQTRLEAECAQERKEVLAAGGLQIVGTERHESRRIDNQLRGRAGRQGDPGASRFYLSLEDDLMRIFAGERIQAMMTTLGMEEGVPIEHKWVTNAVANAQKKVEERNFDIRKNLLEYDDVMNQQRKSIYALRRQVLEGQYRTVPTEDEIKKGVKPEPIVKEIDEELRKRAKPTLERMVKVHGAKAIPPQPPARPQPPPRNATPEQLSAFNDVVRAYDVAAREWQESMRAWQETALAANVADLDEVRWQALERNIYDVFGCRVHIEKIAKKPKLVLETIEKEVGMSLSEQRERMLDLVDDIVGKLVERTCPPNKHAEDWDFDGLRKSYEETFGLKAGAVEKFHDVEDLAERLYKDGEAVLLKKEKEIGPENLLAAFRNFYLREIDRQWLDHLTNMDQLRDGIGLRGYGQRDPKKEYKKEGYDLFVGMTESIKAQVAFSMFRIQVMREEDVRRLEEQRRREVEAQQQRIMQQHIAAATTNAGPGTQPVASSSGIGAARGGARAAAAGVPAAAARGGRTIVPAQQAAAAAAPKVETVRRDKPKVGRNDPCYCGSGKKYKNCHMRTDQQSEPALDSVAPEAKSVDEAQG
ncbi:preprotein translocase subunit SecA [Sandaracinus amylolyticus]|uniref:Protein translocase subunit SecA n=1 Tax=Sandaracinus amylolyticus TaxID=927083 RepID=A0A0F6SG67_9BACT|nr:preprotein translocase subunit SecA [Sandaracinus amylolyticus]AKF08164.1 export cytoplasm protein SecA ATPase RNA helicase [Sandaracinus amylolyticus]